MIFNQFEFLFLFLPAVLIAFNAPRCGGLRPLLLVSASFVFYGLSGIEHAVVLATGIVWVYLWTRGDAIVGSKAWLVIAVVPPVGALFYYKYLGFFLRELVGADIATGGETFELFANIVLPAGISFFTFQLVSFAIDRYRDEIDNVPRLELFALYISFFPQLVAGPILRYRHVADGLARLSRFSLSSERASKAIGYICLGLAAKVLIADTLSNYQAPLIDMPGGLSVTASVFVVFAYSFQIYFDFYGYSLIAIGLGALFGFDFPKNFDRPYEALNPRDFWRRWHLTLSYWIRDYLYLPLGGNEAYARNILIVFALCGLWHGAGWTFIVWGLYHAALVVLYHITRSAWNQVPDLVQTAATFILVSLGWVLFLFDFQGVGDFTLSLLGLNPVTVADPTLEMWAALAVAALICFRARFESIAESLEERLIASMARTAGFAGLFVVTLLFLDRSQTFIYFRF
ncbi:MAG: MBOAT family O-acyltransferase [Rhodospirillales bacterium]